VLFRSRPQSAHVAAFISDATIIPAELSADGAHSQALGMTWESDMIEEFSSATPSPSSTEVKLALLPFDAQLVAADTPGAIAATTESGLYVRDHLSITATNGDFTFRPTSTNGPAIGGSVGIRPHRLLRYPA